MLQVWFSPYALSFLHGQPERLRFGALVRIQDSMGRWGYADLSPWPELGDPSLDQILADSKQGTTKHSLLTIAIDNARLFAQERESINHWLAHCKNEMSNNALISHPSEFHRIETLVKQGFAVVKLKIGISLAKEVNFINLVTSRHQSIKWRLDGNLRLDVDQWSLFWSALNTQAKLAIEYVEDPFPFQIDQWRHWNQVVPLALDFALELDEPLFSQAIDFSAFNIYVVKPSRQKALSIAPQLAQRVSISVTSQLGHSVDSIWSGWMLAQLQSQLGNRTLVTGGTLNHLVLSNSLELPYERWDSLEKIESVLNRLDWKPYADS